MNLNLGKIILSFKVHKGPLAYAEAFLEPNDLNSSYSKEEKKEFKNVFKHLIDLYQQGIELYGKLAHKSNSESEVKSTPAKNPNSSNIPSSKYLEMHCLLQDKFHEFENSFRNLLLVDGVIFYFYALYFSTVNLTFLFCYL